MIDLPRSLSRNEIKRKLFGIDPYFRDAWDDLATVWPQEETRLSDLARAGLVVFRPDAIVSRRIELAQRIFGEMGLRPVAVTCFQYDRMRIREGWRYQLNIATRDRIDVMDMILTQGSSILVLYKTADPDTSVPVSVRLSQMKGPSLPENRTPRDLRAMLGEAQVSVLTFVHISDEPADLVRELGAFLDRPERLRLLEALRDGLSADADLGNAVAEQYQAQPMHDISMSRSIERIIRAVETLPASNRRAAILERLKGGRYGTMSDWRALVAEIRACNVDIGSWNEIAVAATLARKHLDHLRPAIPDVGRELWGDNAVNKDAS